MEWIVIRTRCPKCGEVFSVETSVSERRPLRKTYQTHIDGDYHESNSL
jgi:uncharacterized C2H2 Zn-finger protein